VGDELELWDKALWLAEQQRNKRERAAIVRTLPDL
jgi:DNA-binding transcriptional regulator/RsmH inhibitor MraZ